MEISTQNPNPIFNQDFFKKRGFSYHESEIFKYKKEVITHKVEILVGEIDPDIGTYLALKDNGSLFVTGYWHDEKDFDSEFKF